MAINKAAVQRVARRILDPVAGLILRLGFGPDALTLTGLILSLFAATSAAQGHMLSAALLLFFGGLCDILDGSMARRSGRATLRGAFLDSTLDRLAEIAVFAGLVVYYRAHLSLQLITLLALTGSLMTSYARARAEGLGVDCKVGLLERPERLALLILGLLLAPLRIEGVGALEVVLTVLAVLTYLTTLQRILHVVSRTRALERDRGDEDPSPRRRHPEVTVVSAEPAPGPSGDGEALRRGRRSL
jgi:CDP-diacylglycerol--glycerol-3-phosphate 3-phosphatidyltransferase